MKLLTHISSILLGFLLAGGAHPSALAADSKDGKDAAAVFALLISCPRWEELAAGDTAARDKITDAFSKAARYDNASIRTAMQRYIDCFASEQGDGEHKLSIFNLVVLNRFVFNVPESIPREELNKLPFYLSMRMPETKDGVNLLWPVSITAGQGIAITAQFYANSGPLPDPLGEFDAFAKAFGRRFAGK